MLATHNFILIITNSFSKLNTILTRKFPARHFLSVLDICLVPIAIVSGPNSYCYALCCLTWGKGKVT